MICGFQILFLPEVKAYWMLGSICEDLLVDYYVPSMIGCTTDQEILEFYIKKHFPDIHNHFIELTIPFTLITIPWLLCTYIGLLTWDLTARILDCFFYYGKRVIFQVGLAMFKIFRSKILECEDGIEVVAIFKNSVIDCDQLFTIAFSEFDYISNDDLNLLHFEYRCKVIRDLGVKLQRRRELAEYYKAKKQKQIMEAMQQGEEPPSAKLFANSLFLAQAAEALENFSGSAFNQASIAEAFGNINYSDFVSQTSEAFESFSNSAINQTNIAFDNISKFAQTTFSSAAEAVARFRSPQPPSPQTKPS